MTSINTLIDLPIYVCEHIISFIDNTNSYKNLRVSCSFFYNLMRTLKTFYPQSKNLHRIINFKSGSIHGQYISFYDNNKIFKDFNYYYGSKQGKCSTYYNSGRIKNTTNYKYGSKNGLKISYFLNGGISNISNYKSNCKYKSELSNNIDGSLNYIIKYETPIKYQLTKFLLKNKMVANFNNNNIHGEILILNRNNVILQTSNFIKGYLDGALKTFDNDNIKTLINYHNGYRNGLAYFWDNNNNIQKMCNYKNNMLNGVLKYWSKGVLIETIYRDNKLQLGTYTLRNSIIKLDFYDEKPHGYYIEYEYDDIIRSKIKFSHGHFDKIYKKYYYTGNIQYEYFYNNQNELMITNYDFSGRIKYKLIKKDNIYTIYHKYAGESLIYKF